MRDVARSGLGCDNMHHPSARPADEVKGNPYAAAVVVEAGRAIAYLGETYCRCCRSDLHGTVRSLVGCCSEEGSCIARTTSREMGRRSGSGN
jgi:hypothetical protein